MRKMNIDPILRFSSGHVSHQQEILRYFEGTYKSNWYFLIQAARSNLLVAAIETQKLKGIYERAVARRQRPAETWFVMDLNYKLALAGPLLGTILSASAAIEVFLRMCMRACFEKDTPQRRRGLGTSRMVSAKLAEFDKLSAVKKLKCAYRKLLDRTCPSRLGEEFKHLVTFRNNCFHADPVVILSTGDDETTRRDRILPVSPLQGEPPDYPFLWASNRPLSLSHALRAIRLHDAIVRELFVDGSSISVGSDVHDEHREMNLIENGLPKRISTEYLNQQAQQWDGSVEKELAAVPGEDCRIFLLELERKANLRSVT